MEPTGLGRQQVGPLMPASCGGDWLGTDTWLSLVYLKDENFGSCQLLIKFWPSEAVCVGQKITMGVIPHRHSSLFFKIHL